MKIAVISINMYSKGLNFACPLHTYAFQQLLLEYGIENTILDYKPVYYNNFDLEHPSEYYERLYRSMEKQTREDREEKMAVYAEKRDAYRALYHEREIRYKMFQNFIDSHYIKTDRCYNSDLLETCDPGFDCYICATDVIWKNEPGFGFDRGFFLGSRAMENKWKIAYAASAGRWFANTEEERKTFFHYINDIDFISVRESSLKAYIEKNSDKKAATVLDPVLMHDKAFYEKIAVKPREEKYLLLYHVVEEAADTIEQAVKYAAENHLTLVEVSDKPLQYGKTEGYLRDTVYRYAIGVEEWLGYILYAECVVTNSFHGCCFSILFEKELYVGFRLEDKVDHLLNLFGLNGRKIDPALEITDSKAYPPIDYNKVKEIMNTEREKSRDFLFGAIESCRNGKRNPGDESYREWKEKQTYQVIYNSQTKNNPCGEIYTQIKTGDLKHLESGNLEFRPEEICSNCAGQKFADNSFARRGYAPKGWKLRVRIDREWFWYLEDGSLALKETYKKDENPAVKCFKEGEDIPILPVNHISLMVAEAVWKKKCEKYRLLYNSGMKTRRIFSGYDRKAGTVKRLSSGSLEYSLNELTENNEQNVFVKNRFFYLGRRRFAGWRIRVRIGQYWFWYLCDGSLILKDRYSEDSCGEIRIFSEGETIPWIPANHIETVVAEAVWNRPVKIMMHIWKER